MPKNPFSAIDKRLLGDSGTASEVASNLYTLCDEIGPRFAGSAAYRHAAEFMRDRFAAYGLEGAQLESFDFTAWRRGEAARLIAATSPSRTYDCYALPYGAATGAKGIKASLIDIGSGSADAIRSCRKQIRGRLVLTDGTGGHRKPIYEQCVVAGAVGFIVSNGTKGMILHTGSVADGCAAPIPAVSIAFEDGEELRRKVKQGTIRLQLLSDGRCEQDTTWNVVGELPGTESPEELVLIGGHLDSHDIGPGAFDNGAGAVMVMEVARLLAKQRKHLKRTVRFMGFAAEEMGLLGSHQYAKAHRAELRKARFMLNCDTPALGQPYGLAFHGYSKGEACVALLQDQIGADVFALNREHCHSDHYPLILQGVPTAAVAGGSKGPGVQHYVHMAADTPEKVATHDLSDAACFAARVLLRAASDEAWPRTRRGAAEVKRWTLLGKST